MIHVTAKAIDVLKGGDGERVEAGVQACDGQYGVVENMVGVEAIAGGSTHLPDCPKCAVLWDEAQSRISA